MPTGFHETDVQEIKRLLRAHTIVLNEILAKVTALCQPRGISIDPGTPTEKPMASVSLGKPSKKAPHAAAQGAAVIDFVLQDNQNDTLTVHGVDAVGNPVDISAVASLTPPPSSSDVSILTVSAPTGMTFSMSATGKLSTPGSPVNITATVTFNDGTIGPFTAQLPCDVTAGPAAGVIIVPGTPTIIVTPPPTP